MLSVTDVKPKLKGAVDVKPKMSVVKQETQVYLESRTIRQGEPIGLLLTLTYPEELTFNATRP